MSEKKLDYTLRAEPVWEKRSEFFDINPACQVPVLVDLNGSNICDSTTIHEYLEEMYPAIPLMTALPLERAEVRRLVNWFDHKFAHEISYPLAQEKIFKRFISNNPPNSARIRDAKRSMEPHLGYIAWLIQRRNWLAGDDLSLADLTAAAHLSVVDYLGDIPWDLYPDTKAWYMRIKSRPCFQSLLRDISPGIKPAMHYKELDF